MRFAGLVISGGEWALRGFVAAYDAVNGRQRWRRFLERQRIIETLTRSTTWQTPRSSDDRHGT